MNVNKMGIIRLGFRGHLTLDFPAIKSKGCFITIRNIVAEPHHNKGENVNLGKKTDIYNNFISNNVISNCNITYLCLRIMFEDYGE